MTQRKIKKEYWKMTDGIGRIFGGNSYGVGGYVPQRQEAQKEEAQQPVVQPETKDVDPNKVMEFMNKYVYMVPETQSSEIPELDAETQQRIAGFMEQFEFFYGIVVQEFGEEAAPMVMDLVMDKLMGL